MTTITIPRSSAIMFQNRPAIRRSRIFGADLPPMITLQGGGEHSTNYVRSHEIGTVATVYQATRKAAPSLLVWND